MARVFGRRCGGAVSLALVGVLVMSGCTTPGAPVSPDPVRFALSGGVLPCRIVFGPVALDPVFRLEAVGRIDTPDGPTHVWRGPIRNEAGTSSIEIDGIDVTLSSDDSTSTAWWRLPPDEVGVTTRSLTSDELVAALPTLVTTADTATLAEAVTALVPSADVSYAGRAPDYDVGVASPDGTLAVAGRGVSPEQLEAFTGFIGDDSVGRASGATLVVGSTGEPSAVDGEDFLSTVESLLGQAPPIVAVSSSADTFVDPDCSEPDDAFDEIDASITAVTIVESDVGDLLRVEIDGLPDDHADRRLLRIRLGDVDLLAPFGRGQPVEFPATLTHAESRLLAARLTP